MKRKKKESVQEIALVQVRTPPRNLRRGLFSKYPCGLCGLKMNHKDIVTVHPQEDDGLRMIVAHRQCVRDIAIQPGEEK